MKFVKESNTCVGYCGVVEDRHKTKYDLVFYWSIFTRKYVFNNWFCNEGDILKVTEDVPEELRKRVEDPFFEIDMLKYCSEHDLKLIERY